MDSLIALQNGTILAEDYRIVRVLGAGGFGITYEAIEIPLGRSVAIKEYFPSDFAAREGSLAVRSKSSTHEEDYRWGLDRFIEEAQTLARFAHPNITRVYRYFRQHNTGYMVLQFEEGRSFKSWLDGLGRPPTQSELDHILRPLLDALDLIHAGNFLHRDIAPDNIVIRNDGTPVLIDFGSARGEIAQHSRTVSALVKPGYSPFEQYAVTTRQQGPWTDIYALAATLYHALAGARPLDSPTRMTADELKPAVSAARGKYRLPFLEGIDRALRLKVEERPQSIETWRRELLGPAIVRAVAGDAAPGPGSNARTRKLDGDEPAPVRWQARRKAAGKGGAAVAAAEVVEAPIADPKPHVAAIARKGRRLMALIAEARAVVGGTVARPRKAPLPKPAPIATPDPASEATTELRRAPEPRPGFWARRRAARAARVAAGPARQPWTWPTVSIGMSRRALAVRLALIVGIVAAMIAMQDSAPELGLKPTDPALDTVTDLSLRRVLRGHTSAVAALAISADGRTIASAGGDGEIALTDPETGTAVRRFAVPGPAITALDIADNVLVAARVDGSIEVFDTGTGERVRTLREIEGPVFALTFGEAPGEMIVAGQDRRVRAISLAGHAVGSFSGHDGAVLAIAASAERRLLATGGADRTVRLWDMRRRRLLHRLEGHADDVRAVALTRDGAILASGGNDRTAKLWSARTGALLRSIEPDLGRVLAVALSPGGDLLAVAGEDGPVRLYAVVTGLPAGSYDGHVGPVRAIAFLPDGKVLATAGDDKTIRLWNARVAGYR